MDITPVINSGAIPKISARSFMISALTGTSMLNLCKICHSPTKTFEHPKLGKTYHHCKQCDFIALDEAFLVSESLERMQYEQHNNTIENEGYVAMFEKFIVFIYRYTRGAPLKILDFGSGPGPVLAQLLKRDGHSVSIYDRYFADDNNVFSRTYDLITSTEVVEHLVDPVGTLSMLSKQIEPGGYLALMTQFHPQEQQSFLNWWYPRDPTHISFFSTKTLSVLADRLNMTLIEHDDKSHFLMQRISDQKL